jgi:hypothetical protein
MTTTSRQVARERLAPLRGGTSWAGLAALLVMGLLACVGLGAIAQWTDDQAHAQVQAIDAQMRAVEERAVLRTRTQMSQSVMAAYQQGRRDAQQERGCSAVMAKAGRL